MQEKLKAFLKKRGVYLEYVNRFAANQAIDVSLQEFLDRKHCTEYIIAAFLWDYPKTTTNWSKLSKDWYNICAGEIE